MEKNPNIILFITHDQGRYVGCYNSQQTPNSLKTPNIDHLAERGVRFTNYFCTAPQCSPSRGSIQTSLYPHQNGLMGLENRGWSLPESNKTIPMYLKDNEYTTHLIGLQHESRNATTLGYDTINKRMNYQRFTFEKLEKDILKFLQEYKSEELPFFLNIGTFEVHRPFAIWNTYVDPKEVKVPPFLPDNEVIRKDLGMYYGVINIIDYAIGKIINFLEETRLKEDTLFIFTTDHGCPFPRAKGTLYDPGIKTSLIINWPKSKIFSSGTIVEQMISNLDLLPTLLDLIGAKKQENIEGISFLPILKGDKKKIRTEIYTEKTYHDCYDPMRSVRTDKYKYIQNFEKSETLYRIPEFEQKGLSGNFLKDKIKKPRSMEELYDLETDPNETNNLIKDPNYKAILIELQDRLYNWMERTRDPILKGKIEEPLI